MVKVYDAKTMLQGALYDAQKRLTEGQIKTAFNILKKKIHEIEVKEKADYVRVRWD